ncbi:Juxtaposed with another zinc finger protein 1 [Amphibalanus amphitrite]|uniref:Juxtaposed with another zinc finger protein 1 n=1 Tax=Amphibalanus amphitrite TaxID=1232801 RepID=A0A6A4VJ21_AMPAM|nr:Juxtaposed with another zinc finger protein 1 [Amphibalanus amphitrite]
MAVFLVNVCKFNGCGLTYPSLGDLIQHIEETHIDYDPFSEEQQERQQPSCIPLSSALRFYTNLPSRKPAAAAAKTAPAAGAGSHGPNHGQQTGGGGTAATAGLPTLGRASSTGSASPSVASEEPEYDIMTDSEDSNDSWTTQEEFSAEFIMRYGSKIRKAFKCHCGKSYKTGQGLKNHAVINHAGTPLTTITTSMGEVLQIPTSQVTTLQPVRVSLSALMGGHAMPVKTVAARHLLTTSFKDTLRRTVESAVRDDERGQSITLTGVSRANTIQVAVPASGIIPLSGDKELTAVPVSRLLAQGLGGSIKLAQLGTAAGHLRTTPADATPATTATAVVKVEQTVVRKTSSWDSVSVSAAPTAVSVSCGGGDVTRPVTPPGQQLRAALPPTPLTPGWQGPPFPDSVIEDELPPTPASLLDGGAEPLAGPA